MKRLRKRDDDEEEGDNNEGGSRTIFVKGMQKPTSSRRQAPLLSVAAGADNEDQDGESSGLLPSLHRERKQAFAIPSDVKSRLTVNQPLSNIRPNEGEKSSTQSVSAYSAEGLRLLRAQQSWLERPLGEEVNQNDESEIGGGGGGERRVDEIEERRYGKVEANGNIAANIVNGNNEENEEMMGEEAEAMLYRAGANPSSSDAALALKRSLYSKQRDSDVKGLSSLSGRNAFGSERSLTPPPQAPPGTLRSSAFSTMVGDSMSTSRVEIAVDPEAEILALRESVSSMLTSAERSVEQLNEEVLSLESQRSSLQTQLKETNSIIADASMRFDFFRGLLTQMQEASKMAAEVQNLSVYKQQSQESLIEIVSLETALRSALFGDSVSLVDKELFNKEIDSFVEKVSLEKVAQIAQETLEHFNRWRTHPTEKIMSTCPSGLETENLVAPLLAFVNVLTSSKGEVEMDLSN